jgi:predicted dehydrogenase
VVKVFDERSMVTTSPLFGATDPYQQQIEAFAAALLNNTPTSPDLRDGIAALRVVEAVQRLVDIWD